MMKKYILIMLFTLAGLAGMAQTNEPLPGDAEPLTNQLYLSPSDSTVWAADPFSGLAIKVGTWFKVDSLFKEGYTKAQVDSVVNLTVKKSDVTQGSNLVNPDSILQGFWVSIGSGYAYQSTLQDRSSIRISGIKPNTYYTLSGMIASIASPKGLRFEDSDFNLLSGYDINSSVKTFLTPSDCEAITFTIKNNDDPVYGGIQLLETAIYTDKSPYSYSTIDGIPLEDSVARKKTVQIINNYHNGGFQFGGIQEFTGNEAENTIRIRSINPARIPGGTYRVDINSRTDIVLRYVFAYYRGNFRNRTEVTDNIFTISADTADAVRITLMKSDGSNISEFDKNDVEVVLTLLSDSTIGWDRLMSDDDFIYQANRFRGLKYVAIGTSITYGFIPRNHDGYPGQLPSYAELTARRLGMSFENFGVSGSTVAALTTGNSNRAPFIYRYDDMPDDADIITVEGGANDIRNPRPLGELGDVTDTTFYGALDTLARGLLWKYRYNQGTRLGGPKKIIFITPPKMLNYPELEGYAQAFIDIGEKYGIPVVDMYHNSGLDPERFRILQGTESGYTDMYNPLIPDGVHPSIEGQAMMADVLIGFLKSIM